MKSGDSSNKNSFKYALDFLKRLNALHYQGRPVSQQTIFGEYNVWIFFQNRIFFNELREFAKDKQVPVEFKSSLRVRLQNFVLATFALLVSLLGVLSMILLGKRTLVYSIDRTNSKVLWNDARMDPVYQYLKSSKASFMECFHTTFDLDFVKRLFARRRWGIYIKSIDTMFGLLNFFGFIKRSHVDIGDVDWSSFAPEERAYAKWLLHKYLSSIDLAVFRVRVLRKILSWAKIETLLTIDNTRDYWELILATKMNNIKSYAFQHGHFTKYHVGWLDDGSFGGKIVCPDGLFVWSDFWKQELLRLGTYFPEEAIEVGGLKNSLLANPPKTHHELIGVLIPYEVDSDKLEMKKYIDSLLACGGVKIFFKLRTDLDAERQMSEYHLNIRYHPDLLFVSDVSKHLSDIDVVAGTYSTFLYDMVAYEKPVVLLETSSDFGEGLVVNGLADSLSLDNVCDRIREVASTDKSVLRARKERLFGANPLLMYDTVRNLCGRL